MMLSCCRLLLAALLLLIPGRAAAAFSFSNPSTPQHTTHKHTVERQMATTSTNDSNNDESLHRVDVVVFGVGDLRVDDHGGLKEALRQSSNHVQPVVLLDPSMMQCIPGATCFTYDTACMLHHALVDLEASLHAQFGLELKVVSNIVEISAMFDNIHTRYVHVHVCDLGPADNAMGYGPYSVFSKTLTEKVEIHAWTCRLREEPWNQLETLTDLYPTYEQVFVHKEDAQFPTKIITQQHAPHKRESPVASGIPSIDILVQRMSREHDQNDNMDVKSQANTGLYGTHWGGLDPATVSESSVWNLVEEYTDVYGENDAAWTTPPTVVPRRNPYSLEHAAMTWQASSNHLIAGEKMTRFLAAPLFWGTISPRRLWHASTLNSKFRTSAIKTLVETKEWHALLAARNLQINEQYSHLTKKNGLQYKYWRWHGFLCRYAEYTTSFIHDATTNSNSSTNEDALLWIHGFGASGSQWKGTMEALRMHVPKNTRMLAPDLIGFGQSEKPPLSYTQYMWESYILAFTKEIGNKWESYIVGGNSIGGYTAMGVAASDSAVAGEDVSASGATGSKKCRGVVLMNSAGQIKSKEDIASRSNGGSTVAQITASDALPKCSPPPRSVARALGNGLLWYLRPRIQSICKNLYPINPDAVNDELCESILRDSLDPGAVNVMISGSKLPPPRTANELLGADYGASKKGGEGMFLGDVLVAQGMLDPLNDAKTRAAMLGELREGIIVSPLEAGHCPHDEVPSEVADAIHKWMKLQSAEKVESTLSVFSSQ